MSIADKLIQMKEDLDDVYDAGKQAEYDRLWDCLQQNGERDFYRSAFSGVLWNDETLQPKYPIRFSDTTSNSQSAQYIFSYAGYTQMSQRPKPQIDMTEICKKIDWSNCLNASNIFDNACVKNITIDLSNAIKLDNAFRRSNAGEISNVRLKITEKCISLTNAFYYYDDCTIIFLEGSVIACNGLNTQWATALSKESIVSIFNALSPTTSGLSVTFSKNAVNNAFGINVDDASTYPQGSEYHTLRHSKDNWDVKYV